MKTRGKRVVIVAGTFLVVLLLGTVWLSWDHIRFWWRFEPLGNNEQGYPEYRHRQTGIVMVRVPGGTFWMSSKKEEEEQIISEYARHVGRKRAGGAKSVAAEQPRHKVTVGSFLIAKYELRQSIWAKFMGSNRFGLKGDDFPATSLSWDNCREFCEKTGLRLPSEAQWERACRAGTTTPFSFGEVVSTDQANYDGNCPYGNGQIGEYRNKPVAVDSLKPNRFGLHNMHGNVLEWCQDVYDSQFYSKPQATEFNPHCESGSDKRVFRGGGYGSDAWFYRSARRGWTDPASARFTLGFRPA